MSRIRSILRRLGALDARWVYLLLAAVVAVPFLTAYRLPVYCSSETRKFFQTVESIAADPVAREKVVLVLSHWGFGTEGENQPQMIAFIRHLLRLRLRFAILTVAMDPVLIDAAQSSVEQCIRLEQDHAAANGLPPPNPRYGLDWINLGMKPAPAFHMVARGLSTDIPGFAVRDHLLKKELTVENFPILRGLRSAADLALIAHITAGDDARDTMGIIQPHYPGLRVVTATTGITAIDLYPYIRSGQLSGLMDSARGAAEYLSLLNPLQSDANPLPNAVGLGKMLLVLLIAAGNLAWLASRRAAPSPPPAEPPTPASTASFHPARGRAALLVAGLLLFGAMATRALSGLAQAPPADAEARIGGLIALFLILGVFSFLFGDNPYYRVVEHVLVGSGAAFTVFQIANEVLWPKWLQPGLAGLAATTELAATADGSAGFDTRALWLLALFPGSLWYFGLSRRHVWWNRLLIAAFIGVAIGPEFGKRIGLLLPQIADCFRPAYTSHGGVEWGQLFFVAVTTASLAYFIFFLSPRGRITGPLLAFGRVCIMVGLGAMFANAVNTRFSWLAPRIDDLVKAFTALRTG